MKVNKYYKLFFKLSEGLPVKQDQTEPNNPNR